MLNWEASAGFLSRMRQTKPNSDCFMNYTHSQNEIDCARRIFIVSAVSALTVDASYLVLFVLDEPFRNSKEAPPSIPM